MIQFITHANDRYNYLDGVRIALEGGCRWIQLRMKDASEEEVLKTAESTRKLCRQYDAVFLLDDYVELVERSGADGVHLGKDDMPIDEARRLLGKDKSLVVQQILLRMSNVFILLEQTTLVAVHSALLLPRKSYLLS